MQYRTLPNLLSTVYSEYKWDESKFEQQQSDIWTDIKLTNYFVEWLKNQKDKEIATICQYVKEIGSKDILAQRLQEMFPNTWKTASSESELTKTSKINALIYVLTYIQMCQD